MSTILQLYDLQEIDLEIDRKSQELDNLNSKLNEDQAVISARASLDEARKQLTGLERSQHTIDWEIEDIGKKIAAEDEKLYAGKGKNSRELMDLQKEIDIIKGKRNKKEDGLLLIMIEVDTAQNEVNRTSNELDKTESDWQKDQKTLLVEKSVLESALATLQQKRNPLIEQVGKSYTSLYEGLRLAKQGRAVAKMEQGRCMGCRISLPISDQQKAKAGIEIVTCSNCGRILCII